MPSTTAYIFDGGTLTATLDTQGTAVPVNTKRIIRSALLLNTTGAPVLCSVIFVAADASTHPKIYNYPVGTAPNNSYCCPELIGKGVNALGSITASGLGVSFSYTAVDVVG